MPSLTLVSPYPEWLTEQAATFLSDAGARVLDVVPVKGDGSIYDLSPASVLAAVADGAPDRSGALLLAGTGMPTLEAVRTLSRDWPQPVLSSATCSAAWVASVTEGHA
jgi:maleate isomerase